MTSFRRQPPQAGAELAAIMLAAWVLFAAIPLSLGEIGLSWDALNHHVYLGWIAEHPRFDRDFLAASYQSFQFPYLYWPFYKLFESGIDGAWAGVLLVTLNLTAVPPLWMLSRQFVPEVTWWGAAMRALAVALAFLTGVVLSLFDSTSNDLLAAIPLVWSIALAMEPRREASKRAWKPDSITLWSGAMAGIAVGLKLSNGPLAILMPILWWLRGRGVAQRSACLLWAGAAAAVAYLAVYGWWGWQLWHWYGNPVYPFYDGLFTPMREWAGWREP